jgi:hypothetical protein
MSSRGKKTTMAKLTRETRLRERRMEKKARKDARRQTAALNRVQGEAAPNDPEPAATPDAPDAPDAPDTRDAAEAVRAPGISDAPPTAAGDG